MDTLRCSRDRQTWRWPTVAALALCFLLLTSGSARPLAQESVSIMPVGLSGGAVPIGRRASGWSSSRAELEQSGSAPPSCISKCGNCLPCKPVLLPVQPGLNTGEYYPEAWGCKCGNMLFIP